MTNLKPSLNQVNVCFLNEYTGNGVNHQYHNKVGNPIRFIPVECLLHNTTGQVGWYGSTWEVYKTKTGKLVCSLTEWSCVDGDSDGQTNLVADDEAQLYEKLSGMEGTAASRVREWLAKKSEVVPTI